MLQLGKGVQHKNAFKLYLAFFQGLETAMERRTAEMAGVEGAGPVLTLVEACCRDQGLLPLSGLPWGCRLSQGIGGGLNLVGGLGLSKHSVVREASGSEAELNFGRLALKGSFGCGVVGHKHSNSARSGKEWYQESQHV